MNPLTSIENNQEVLKLKQNGKQEMLASENEDEQQYLDLIAKILKSGELAWKMLF